jgi:uncharacterized protein YndB with AHSA1/START domain
MPEIMHSMAVRGPAAKPEQVYRALTEQEELQAWLTQEVDAQPVVGSVASFYFNPRTDVIRVEIVALEPAERVVWKVQQFIGLSSEQINSTITFRLMRSAGGTFVDFRMDGWESTGDPFSSVNFKWGYILTSLKMYIETGKGMPHVTGEKPSQ